jgi:hypothetical protein
VRQTSKRLFHKDSGPSEPINVVYSSSTLAKVMQEEKAMSQECTPRLAPSPQTSAEQARRLGPWKGVRMLQLNPLHYAESATLAFAEANGCLPGINIGTPSRKKMLKLAMLSSAAAIVHAIIVRTGHYNCSGWKRLEGEKARLVQMTSDQAGIHFRRSRKASVWSISRT